MLRGDYFNFPPVETPATPPAADTQVTQTVLHPVWQIPYASGPDWAIWINMANMTIYFTGGGREG